jgi:hypothetical protein
MPTACPSPIRAMTKARPACLLAAALLCGHASARPSAPADADLQATIADLDEAVFDAFNRCADPAELQRHAGYFDPGVEFYHDTGGVTWTREAMLANTRRHACGRYTRERVPGTLQVYPVPGFGAIAQGRHRFCQSDTHACDGLADFVIVWRLREGRWQITRVLSFGHRTARD